MGLLLVELDYLTEMVPAVGSGAEQRMDLRADLLLLAVDMGVPRKLLVVQSMYRRHKWL
jgi:hypothetical protein